MKGVSILYLKKALIDTESHCMLRCGGQGQDGKAALIWTRLRTKCTSAQGALRTHLSEYSTETCGYSTVYTRVNILH